jgi:hypothetical protein
LKSTAEDAAAFRAECLKIQKDLGLFDWALTFKVEEGGDGDVEALCDYDCETRMATMTYYLGVENVTHPKDNAAHEMYHLAFADMLLVAVEAGMAAGISGADRDAAENDPRLAREEHRLIERFIQRRR